MPLFSRAMAVCYRVNAVITKQIRKKIESHRGNVVGVQITVSMPKVKKSGYDLYETTVLVRCGDVKGEAKKRWDKLPDGSRDIWNDKAERKKGK